MTYSEINDLIDVALDKTEQIKANDHMYTDVGRKQSALTHNEAHINALYDLRDDLEDKGLL